MAAWLDALPETQLDKGMISAVATYDGRHALPCWFTKSMVHDLHIRCFEYIVSMNCSPRQLRYAKMDCCNGSMS